MSTQTPAARAGDRGLRELVERVRQAADGERALDSVRSITRFHRIQASPGYGEAAEWLASRLGELPLEVEIDRVPGDGRTRVLGQLMPEGWEGLRAGAWLVAGDTRTRLCDFEAQPLSIVQRSDAVRGRFPLVAAGDGSDAADLSGVEVRGAVVLTRAHVHRALELAVRQRGAAGLLCDGRRLMPPVRERWHDVDSVAYTSFWWNADEPRGWGFVVSPATGDALRARLARGERLELEVGIESRRFATEIPLVSARIPGETPAEVLVLSHLCHPRPGANDNASGAAANLETARVLAALRADGSLRLRRGVRFLWMPELTGTFAWLGQSRAREDRLVAGLNLDMVGEDQSRCGSTLLIEHPPCFAASFAEELLAWVRAASVDWVSSYSGPGHYSLHRMAEVPYSGGSDHAVLVDPTVGVPCPMLIQWPDRFYHSSLDTPDQCDPRSLALAARCAAAYAGFLAEAGDGEALALLDLVARGARRRLLAALDAEDPRRALRRESIRGQGAIRSLARLGVDGSQIEARSAAFARFCEREAGLGVDAGAPRENQPERTSPGGGVPRRRKRGPLDFLDHMNPGFAELGPEDRERWSALRGRCRDPLLELAWFAADGERSITDITDLAELEAGERDPDALREFFDLTARMGLTEWREG